ncbi:MAG: hypothetical protein ACSHW7_01130 [Patiriisocius sp.]|uniref:hypothetical protein n=1 Tax=Patiriisocius sp. TaxID=2822396 RepID=UPI003EF87642
MKKIFLTLITFCAILSSCSEEPVSSNEIDHLQFQTDFVCFETPLIAGQNYNAGRVTIVQLGLGNYEVSYEMDNGWELDYAHLFAGDCALMPTTKKGNPKVGHFPFKSSNQNGDSTLTFTLNFDDFPNCMCLAAHAEVHKGNQRETAWAAGTDFPGGSWATYVEFCKDSCDL